MPTYQYKCTECGYRFEEFQKITDAPIKSCPKCQGKTKRVITGGAGFLLKGSGFYSTDYRSESYRKSEKQETSGVASSTATASETNKKKPAPASHK
jgi:putative FmdB family regulatory protein